MRQTSGNNSLEVLYAQAAEAVRVRSRSFHLATSLAPPELARAAHAVYWFCAYTRELARQAESPEQGHQDLSTWHSLVTAGTEHRMARHPVLEVFLDAADRNHIPHHPAIQLIEGARMELDHTRFDTFLQLREYGYRTGGSAAELMAYLIGFRGPALEYLADLGLAVELTDVLCTLGSQVARGRVFLPREEMESFGYRYVDLMAHARNDAFARLMRFQIDRAREYFAKAEPGLALLDSRGRFAARYVYDLNLQTLARVEASGFDVFQRRPSVPAAGRYWLTARALAGPITKRLWRSVSA